MKNLLHHLFLSLLFLYSCAPAAYIPIGIVQNVPLLTDSSKTRFSLNLGSDGFSPSFAKVISHQNLMILNLSFINIHTDEECETCKYNHRFLIEMAFGKFRSKDETQVLEWFVGGGFGNSNVQDSKFVLGMSDEVTGIREKAKFIQPFVQFDYGILEDNYEIAYSIKTVAPYFLTYTHINNPDHNETISQYDKSWIVFLQPAVTARWGFKRFKAQCQFGLSAPIIAREYAKFSIFASVGLTLNN